MAAAAYPLSRLSQRPKLLLLSCIFVPIILSLTGFKWWPESKDGNPSQTASTSLAQREVLQRAQAYLTRFDRKDHINSAVALLEAATRGSDASAAVYATLAEAYVRKYIEFRP